MLPLCSSRTLGNSILILSSFWVLAFTSCSRDSTKTDQQLADRAAFKALETESSSVSADLKKKEVEMIIKNLPAPSEIPYLVQKSGAGYDPNLLNSGDKVDSYRNTEFKTSLNLGIYSADIGYLCSYGKAQEALTYLDHTKVLADHLGVTSAFDLTFARKFEDSIGNPEYLLELIDESIDQVSKFLRTEDRTNLSILVLSGGFVEGFYLTAELLTLYSASQSADPEVQQIFSRVDKLVFQQKEDLEALIELLHTLEPSSDITRLIAQMDQLNQILESKPEDGSVEMEWVGSLNKKVVEIRSGIVS